MGQIRTRLLVVDDHPVVAEGLARLLSREPDLHVEWIALSIAEAMQICETHAPDLAVVDISLGDGSGIELIKWLHSRFPLMPILVMSMHEESLYAGQALQAGARGYITKQRAPRHIAAAIRGLRDGTGVYTGSALPEAAGELPVLSLQHLSERERDVFDLIGAGLRKREIATRLGLSVNTIETHRTGIKKKLRFRSAAELARFAYLHSHRA
jgi:DNA-binding NarL/FixJ family response regulator